MRLYYFEFKSKRHPWTCDWTHVTGFACETSIGLYVKFNNCYMKIKHDNLSSIEDLLDYYDKYIKFGTVMDFDYIQLEE